MSRSTDVIVIGAGLNGLTTAAFLARGGRRVIVVERRAEVGGLAAAESFHPGYSGAGVLQQTGALRPAVVRELELQRHGLVLRPEPAGVLVLGRGGEALWLHGDPQRAAETIGERSERDARAYLRWHEFLDRVRGVVAGWFDAPPLDLVRLERLALWDAAWRGLALQRLGRRGMQDLLRVPPMAVADWLGDSFEGDLLSAGLALPALSGGFAGPRSPGTAANLLIAACTAGPGVVGGGPALAAALERCCRSLGAEIRTGCGVERILTDGGGVRGVALESGEELSAPTVAASCDPRQALLDRLAPGTLPSRLEHRLRHYRCRGTSALVRYALAQPPRFPAVTDEAVEFVHIAGSLHEIERAFDPVKYRALPREPVLELHLPSAANAATAPPGGAVLSALVHFVPHNLEGGWTAERRETLAASVESTLAAHGVELRGHVVAREVLAPPDLESRFGLTGGQLQHGEPGLDQLLIRPVPECVGYATPVRGLFLCGSGSHPGGGGSCAPGRLAAAAIIRRA